MAQQALHPSALGSAPQVAAHQESVVTASVQGTATQMVDVVDGAVVLQQVASQLEGLCVHTDWQYEVVNVLQVA